MKKHWVKLITIAVLFTFTACVTTVPALFMQDDFNTLKIDKIHLLPTLDLRIDTTKKLNTDKWVHTSFKKALKKKSYATIPHTQRSMIANITEESLLDTSNAWLTNIKIEGAKWLLLPVLHDVSTKATFGSTGNAEMSALLFDLEQQVLVWKHKAASKVGQGGLIGLAMKGAMAQEAIQTASSQLVLAFPKR